MDHYELSNICGGCGVLAVLRAAKQFDVPSSSFVSRVADLEKSLGCEPIERTTRNVQLTRDRAWTISRKYKDILQQLEQSKRVRRS